LPCPVNSIWGRSPPSILISELNFKILIIKDRKNELVLKRLELAKRYLENAKEELW